MAGPASFKALLNSAASFIGAGINIPRTLMSRNRRRSFKITGKRGKKGRPFCRIVRLEPGPVCQRQVGITWRNGVPLPIMQRYRTVKVLHSTKGWRAYTNTVPGLGAVA